MHYRQPRKERKGGGGKQKAESKSSSKKVRRKSAKRIAAGYESKLRRTGKGVTAQHSTAAQREPNIGVSE